MGKEVGSAHLLGPSKMAPIIKLAAKAIQRQAGRTIKVKKYRLTHAYPALACPAESTHRGAYRAGVFQTGPQTLALRHSAPSSRAIHVGERFQRRNRQCPYQVRTKDTVAASVGMPRICCYVFLKPRCTLLQPQLPARWKDSFLPDAADCWLARHLAKPMAALQAIEMIGDPEVPTAIHQ